MAQNSETEQTITLKLCDFSQICNILNITNDYHREYHKLEIDLSLLPWYQSVKSRLPVANVQNLSMWLKIKPATILDRNVQLVESAIFDKIYLGGFCPGTERDNVSCTTKVSKGDRGFIHFSVSFPLHRCHNELGRH